MNVEAGTLAAGVGWVTVWSKPPELSAFAGTMPVNARLRTVAAVAMAAVAGTILLNIPDSFRFVFLADSEPARGSECSPIAVHRRRASLNPRDAGRYVNENSRVALFIS